MHNPATAGRDNGVLGNRNAHTGIAILATYPHTHTRISPAASPSVLIRMPTCVPSCLPPCHLPTADQICHRQLRIRLASRRPRPQSRPASFLHLHSSCHTTVCRQHYLRHVHHRPGIAGYLLFRAADCSVCAGNRVCGSYVPGQGRHGVPTGIPPWVSECHSVGVVEWYHDAHASWTHDAQPADGSPVLPVFAVRHTCWFVKNAVSVSLSEYWGCHTQPK